MTPQITFSLRCPRHAILLLPGKACSACLEERRTGQPVRALRGERLEDHDGKPIETLVRPERGQVG